MKFQQLDRVTELVPGERIAAQRTLRADEEYLRDHFPLFPVMPGVLMLEALYQAACHLLRATDDYRCSVLRLAEARNVKFADFMEPGNTLEITVEMLKNEPHQATFKAVGMKGEVTCVSARLTVGKTKLSEGQAELEPLDHFLSQQPRRALESLRAGKPERDFGSP